MTTFHKIVVSVGIVLGTCLGMARLGSAQSSTLTAFYTAPVVSMAPMWIAKEAGLFKKQGLDVKLVFIASGPIGTAAVLSGEADVGIIGGFAPLRAMVGGAKGLVIIGQSKNLITSKIVAKKEIGTVQDLRGKRLGIDRIGSNPGYVRASGAFAFSDRYLQRSAIRSARRCRQGSLPVSRPG